MGWNRGYTIYEQQVVEAYDTGLLSPPLLQAIISPFEDTDMDHGGCCGLKTNDGLSADEVVVKLLAPKFWKTYDRTDNIEALIDENYERFIEVWTKIVKSF